MKKGFTLIELVVAIALLSMVLGFSSVIFKTSIEAHRTAGANSEIMRKLRAITDQLNSDFKGLQKDGYMVLLFDELNRKEFENSMSPAFFRADRLYYFSTGDFQSWFDTDIRSNIARVYFGHDANSLDLSSGRIVSKWNLARDVLLLTPGVSRIDCDPNSYAYYKANPIITQTLAKNLVNGVSTDIQFDPNNIRRLMCQSVGEVVVEWTDANSTLLRWLPDPNTIPPGEVWTPTTQSELWPKALKFTFTLYDSKGIIKNGRTFTHIVYLD